MNFGKAIKQVRKEKGMTQRQLADICGISVTALSQIETNDSFPQKSTLKKICDSMKVPYTYLFFLSLESEDIPNEKKVIYDTIHSLMENLLLQEIK